MDLNFEQTPGDGEGQGSLLCYNLWGCKELDMTYGLNNNIQLQQEFININTYTHAYILKKKFPRYLA